MAEVRIAPDGRAVAIKNELSPDGWSVMTVDKGGHHTEDAEEVAEWPAAAAE